MSGSLFFYIIVVLLLGLCTVCGYLYWRLQLLENRRDSLTAMYLDQQQQQISTLQRDLSRLMARLEQQAAARACQPQPLQPGDRDDQARHPGLRGCQSVWHLTQ
jgi:Tfp pilus assembly protein PilN